MATSNVVPLFRRRAAVCADLSAACASLGHLADDWHHRDVTDSDISGVDATIAGVARLLVELRAISRPPPRVA